jgi:predicted secreted protein
VSWFTGILVYVIIWWLVLFTVLPWGVRPPDDPEPGHALGAPERPMIGRKMLVTTAIAGGIFLAVYAVIESGLIDFRALAPDVWS